MNLWKPILGFGISGTVISLGIVEYLRRTIHGHLLQESPLAHEGRRIFYSNRQVKDFLGVPIKEDSIDTWNGRINFDNGYESKLNFHVKGQHKEGFIHIEGRKNQRTGDWVLTQLSLMSEDLETKLFSIIPPENENNSTSE